MTADQRRERIFNLPGVVLALLALLVAIHAVRVYWLPEADDDRLIALLAFVPGRITLHLDPSGMGDALARLGVANGELEVAQFFLGGGEMQPWTIFSYSLLHADWTHVGVNSIWLAAFGAPVARRFGTTHAYDLAPVVGASAAISGAMGAAVRFVFHPDAPLGSSDGFRHRDDSRAYQLPPIALQDVWRDRRVVLFVAIWFVVNLAFGLVAGPLHITEGVVAWEAHVGGFLGGLLLFGLFDPTPDRGFPPGNDERARAA